MEYRQLGNSGLRVPVLSFGTATFGGGNDFFKAWGSTQVDEATRMVNLCMDAGVTLFDTANGYSNGAAEEILGKSDFTMLTEAVESFFKGEDKSAVAFLSNTQKMVVL